MMTIATTVTKQSSPVASRKKYPAPQRPSIEELKKKYEANTPSAKQQTPMTPKQSSPKMLKKSKVKQMASMFNSKISQIIRREPDAGKYTTLVNELSPEPKPHVKAAELSKPLPLPKLRYNKEKAPLPSPRTKAKAKAQQKSMYFVSEDNFAKLTVKDKAQLYTQFINDMSKKNPKFGKHAELMEANVKKVVARGEVVNEKQASVKRLLEELEARCNFPKQTVSPLALQRINSMRKPKANAKGPVKSKEFEDILEKKVSHITTLTVTLQPIPEMKKQRRARSLPRRRRDHEQVLKELGIIEPSHKRNNDEMRSSLPIEAYAPPKKIRRTRIERLTPQIVFQNQQLENLFFTWLRERQDKEQEEIVKESELREIKTKSSIDKLLEEAIAKLETVETKQKDVKPPENELQKSHDHNPAALSEHQLRIQASLQRLNIPDWFRQYNQNQKSPDGAGTGSAYKPGNFTRKRTQDSGRWVGLNSKTTSLSSLGSQRSDRSPLLLSPSAHSHHGGQSTQHAGQNVHAAGGTGTGASGGAFSRWSTSHLNSSQTSPSVSQRGSFSRGGPINSSFMSVNSGHSVIRNSMRQPYLGWRSQEKLSQRTAHERLASSLLSQQQRTSPTSQTVPANNDKLQPVTPEIQSSIKEVTSAIVHYVNDQTNQQRSRSTSPNSRKCWLESSFVGTRPLDSPQTPIIENTPLITAAQAAASTLNSSFRPPLLNNNNNNNINNNNNNLQYANHNIDFSTSTGNDLQQLTRMNGGLNNGTSSSSSAAGGVNLGVGGALVSESQTPNKQQTQQHHMPQKPQPLQQLQLQQLQQQQQQQKENLLTISKEEQQRLRRRSEGDAATKQKQQQQQQEQQQQHFEQKSQHYGTNAKTYASDTITTVTNTNTTANGHAIGATAFLPPRRVSLGDSSESNNRTASASGELQIKCRNNKCDRTATPADAKKYYKSCHNCTYLYCSRECRRAHWEKHRKACLHSRVSNLCRQVLASCKDDSDSLRHLSLLARKGFLSQGRGVVRILFRSPESAEGFIKNGFQCMGEASYVRWPDLMPAEMGLELYSELLKLSTEYRPDSKMLVYVAVCVVSEAPGMGQAPVRWERQLVSRCAKLKLCKTVLAELEQQQQPLPLPVTVVAVPEPTTEVLILTFNPQLRNSTAQRELVLSNILDILSRRGVILRKHYPEIFQRLQTYTEGQTDKFNPVTLHPRDSHTGQNFVCIIMPVQSETEIIKLPSIADGGNRVTTIDVGSTAALAQLDDDELLTRTATLAS
ncbi:uncharacterized protein LOC124418458 isoform X2 [Lucilia cuprina]|uniref:uncharacterized protein LOC124418458 isoform X2 n=1 Tax=Lucilia cuprina TaxID=7375 RepID=UPI001F057DAC|nr:uncharacterized protein LOC124418458 isoform X2 [Lucilia cuprina]